MKRIPISYYEFLRDVLARAPLSWEEQALVDRVLRDGRTREMEQATRALVDALVERGVFVVLERGRDGEYEWFRLRDPKRRLRVRLRLPQRPWAPEAQVVPLPLDPAVRTGVRHHQVQGLLAIQGNLVSYDRVMPPRELIHRLERALQDLVPVTSAEFHALEMPPGEDWPSPAPANGLPPRMERLEALARQRDHLLYYPDLGRDGSLLLLGMGDETTGWRGVLTLRQAAREYFNDERIGLCLLVAQHFQSLVSTSIRLQGLIFYDFLTGIYNRSYFEEQIEREIAVADRRGQSMALLIADIDDFKAFNTRYGYEGGDRVLATVACVLKAALRHTDTLARYGGEEFAAILSSPVPREEAKAIAERLRAAVAEEPMHLHGLDGEAAVERVSVSIGGVLYPEGGRSVRDLWNASNRMLLQAKSRGKNQVCFLGDSGTA